MTETAQKSRPDTSGRESAGGGSYTADGGARGKTSVADSVVEKIAGMAARDVDGVHAMGGGISRAYHAARERVPGTTKSVSHGVRVEVGEKQTAIDLEIVIDYGVSISDVASSVRESVISAVEWMTGLEVVEVNIFVSDVSLPGEEEEQTEQEQPRLR
ncbi:Asp23/Gls24 family envelope stress response protein [Streptomyces xinghaiensis]|uniref:Asp23/Gls24 family envelope stress response protein n=1 Tax=Streptomyces xinghaiensis TaxID=1038928 RepID=UPI000317C2B5|nr:Asp23/Gls24 family envelope stress response protein [Streptomyces xinghaiensis]MZE81855.1 Asp23/Gls24 family envelope stress response protein [Streptomyces sp. SID5475]